MNALFGVQVLEHSVLGKRYHVHQRLQSCYLITTFSLHIPGFVSHQQGSLTRMPNQLHSIASYTTPRHSSAHELPLYIEVNACSYCRYLG